MRNIAEMAQVSYADFLQLILVFHMVDAGAYTSLGGTVGSLNYVFEFDQVNKKMSYSSSHQSLINLLHQPD